VDAPTSRQTRSRTPICQCCRACSSLSPPRPTYFKSSPSRRISEAGSTEAPGFSTFCWLTSTLPASTRAWARSRDGTRPRSSNNLSTRILLVDVFNQKNFRAHTRVCNLYKFFLTKPLSRYLLCFPQYYAHEC